MFYKPDLEITIQERNLMIVVNKQCDLNKRNFISSEEWWTFHSIMELENLYVGVPLEGDDFDIKYNEKYIHFKCQRLNNIQLNVPVDTN